MNSYIFKIYIVVFSVFYFFLSVINLHAKQEKRLALLIGNSNYQYAGKLDNPINDVRAIKKVLEQLGFTVLKYEDCSQNTMKRAIDKFGRQLKTKDVGLFFYAGHGVQVDGYNYLLPINAKLDNENDAEYDCVRAGRILAKMESAGSRTNIVILDACRANPFERAWRRGAKGSGLAFMNAPSGSLIAYSTAPGKTALDGGGKNSPYTTALLEHIDAPDITVLQMFQRVRSTVMSQSDKKQIPWESTSLRGDFYFRGGGGIKVTKKVNEKPAIIKAENARLFVDTEPANARVRILNIKPRFVQGIELEPGHYHIEVSHNGYKTKKLWLRLRTNETRTLDIQLDILTIKEPAPIPKVESKSSDTMKQQDSHDALLLYYSGLSLYEEHQYSKAIQEFTKAIALDPNNWIVYAYRGLCYYKLKQNSRAIQDYTQAIDLEPTEANPHYNRGLAYSALKQDTQAIQEFTKAIDLDPLDWRAYYSRGHAYFERKQYTESIQDYTQAIAVNPSYTNAYNNRGFAYYRLNRISQGCADAQKGCELGDCSLLETFRQHNLCN